MRLCCIRTSSAWYALLSLAGAGKSGRLLRFARLTAAVEGMTGGLAPVRFSGPGDLYTGNWPLADEPAAIVHPPALRPASSDTLLRRVQESSNLR
jgi:hypothetical protein